MWVRSLGQEDPLEEGMATPLHYSCPENPMDRGTWWATGSQGGTELDTTEATQQQQQQQQHLKMETEETSSKLGPSQKTVFPLGQ